MRLPLSHLMLHEPMEQPILLFHVCRKKVRKNFKNEIQFRGKISLFARIYRFLLCFGDVNAIDKVF